MQRTTIPNDLGKIHFRTDFIFQIQLLFGELVRRRSWIPLAELMSLVHVALLSRSA